MLSGKVLEIYNKYERVGRAIDPTFPGLDFGPGHIVWADYNIRHKHIDGCLSSGMCPFDWACFQGTLEECDTDRELFDYLNLQIAFDGIGRGALFELRQLSELEIWEGFVTYRPDLPKPEINL